MSLAVPITTADVMSSGQGSGYAPVPVEQPQFSTSAPPTAGVGVSASAGHNTVAFGAAGWIVFGILLILALHEWGFRFAHVP